MRLASWALKAACHSATWGSRSAAARVEAAGTRPARTKNGSRIECRRGLQVMTLYERPLDLDRPPTAGRPLGRWRPPPPLAFGDSWTGAKLSDARVGHSYSTILHTSG